MTHRPPLLQAFAEAAEAAILASVPAQSAAHQAAARVFERLRARVGRPGSGAGVALPVCDHLPAVLARSHPTRGAVVAALRPLLPQLDWARRKTARPEDGAFWHGHANAMLIGPGGLETRDDLWIGATIIAPGVTYPDHSHPPEETYLPLTAGEWWNSATDWTDPGAEGLFYNTPGITHAMRALPGQPFLALWFLPV